MKKSLLIALSAALFLSAAAIAPTLAAPYQAAAADAVVQRKITVNGQGIVKVKPDVAYVTLGVQTESKDAKEAQTKNTELMNRVISAVTALGIAEKDLKTSGYYMSPNYSYTDNKEQITGYVVTNNITVTVRAIEKAGTVIDAAITAGANIANSIQFNVSDPMPYYQQALAASMENAKLKASAIADVLGVKIDLPLEITEQYSYYSPTYGNMNTGRAEASVADMAIQTGELEISSNVQVVYSY